MFQQLLVNGATAVINLLVYLLFYLFLYWLKGKYSKLQWFEDEWPL